MADTFPVCKVDHNKDKALPSSFDWAVPIDWAIDVATKTKACGFLGCIVWSYDGPGLCGNPYALCNRGRDILAKYQEVISK